SPRSERRSSPVTSPRRTASSGSSTTSSSSHSTSTASTAARACANESAATAATGAPAQPASSSSPCASPGPIAARTPGSASAGADERLDQRVLAKPLDRRHLAVDRVRERDTGEPRHAVDLDCAGAAVPLVARDLRPRQAELLPQDVRETRPDRSVEDVLAAVHREAQLAHVDVTATVSAI